MLAQASTQHLLARDESQKYSDVDVRRPASGANRIRGTPRRSWCDVAASRHRRARRRRLGNHQAPPPEAVQHVERYPPSTTGWESRVSDGHERGRRDWAAARTPGRGSRLPRSRGRRPAVSLRPPQRLHRLSWRSASKDRGQFPVVTSRTQPGSRRRDRLLRDRLVVISSGGSARPGARRSLARPEAAGLAIAAVWPQMTFPHAGPGDGPPSNSELQSPNRARRKFQEP